MEAPVLVEGELHVRCTQSILLGCCKETILNKTLCNDGNNLCTSNTKSLATNNDKVCEMWVMWQRSWIFILINVSQVSNSHMWLVIIMLDSSYWMYVNRSYKWHLKFFSHIAEASVIFRQQRPPTTGSLAPLSTSLCTSITQNPPLLQSSSVWDTRQVTFSVWLESKKISILLSKLSYCVKSPTRCFLWG